MAHQSLPGWRPGWKRLQTSQRQSDVYWSPVDWQNNINHTAYIKVVDSEEERLFYGYTSENLFLSIDDVLPFVTELRLMTQQNSYSDSVSDKVFEALKNGKQSELVVLEVVGDIEKTDAGVWTDAGACKYPLFKFEKLAKAIASGALQSLKRLQLRGHPLSGHNITILADAFQEGEACDVPNLTHLDLSCGFNFEQLGLRSLAMAFTSGRLNSLEDLDFSHNKQMSYGVSILIDSFQEGVVPNLKRLSLEETGMEKAGMMSLAGALALGRLSSLEDLNVRNNLALSGEDMSVLADAFQAGEASVAPNLKYLNLASTNMEKKGMTSLARALASGRLNSLKKLDLSGAYVSDLSVAGSAILSALHVNNCLTVDIEWRIWDTFPDLDRRIKQLLARNSAYVDILAGLSKSPTTKARFAKLYLCGNPEVGKTTLRNALQGSSRKLRWPFKTGVDKRTRGIEVTQFMCESKEPGENPIAIRVWDMAGQEDYHLVHNAFFPTLTSAEGRATTFVVVCTTTDLKKSMQELDYWLRYIASSCDNLIHDSLVQHQRHVLVVLNNIGGHRDARKKCAEDWKKVLETRRRTFQGFLDIQTDLFLMDVRKARDVQVLKTRLSKYSRNRLKDKEVPAICQLIQENGIEWSQGNELFPVLQWGAFVDKVRQFSDYWPEENIIEAAGKYLHEAGVLIYIHKKFPPGWEIPDKRLVVMNPNWLCNEIVGRMFLQESMLEENEPLFRLRVHKSTGSISIVDFKNFFQTMYEAWSDSNIDDLIMIVLWLGLCYKGRDQNVFIPALIREHGTPGGHWTPLNLRGHDREQWVMGFSIEHEGNEVALAPMSLWHRFQVEIAQSPRFNGLVHDNDLVADKYFMTFNVDFMSVLVVCQNSLYNLTRADIYDQSMQQSNKSKVTRSRQAQRVPALTATGSPQLNVVWGSPTFDGIDIFVMPVKKSGDDLETSDRKQRQVDLASDLVEILLELWNEYCPGVKYVHRVVWPWPVAQPGAEIIPERNLEVTEVQQMVLKHGPGRKIQWEIGSNSWVTGDQLLSTKDKGYVFRSVKNNLGVLQEGLREAVQLRIFPSDVLLPKELSGETSASDQNAKAAIPLGPTGKFVLGLVSGMTRVLGLVSGMTRLEMKLDTVDKKLDTVDKKLDTVDKKLEEGFRMVLEEQKMLLRQHLHTEEVFIQDRANTCPKYIYLGNETSGVWTTVKNAFSETVRLHFACEEQHHFCGPHAVKNQRGLDVSELKDWVKTILPCLKVTLTVVFLSAKVAANIALPGAGLLVPGFGDWSQCQSLSAAIASATGYSIEELDKLMVEGIGLDVTSPRWDARQVYGKSREAITRLIGKLSPDEYEKNLGLRRVHLKSSDDTSPSIVWICNECFENYRNHDSSMVHEFPLPM